MVSQSRLNSLRLKAKTLTDSKIDHFFDMVEDECIDKGVAKFVTITMFLFGIGIGVIIGLCF